MKTMKRKKIELLRKSHRQPTIDFIRIREGAQIPARATRDAAGYDLSSAESCTVPSGGRVLVHTGVSVRIPRHYHIEIRPRSGLALRRRRAACRCRLARNRRFRRLRHDRSRQSGVWEHGHIMPTQKAQKSPKNATFLGQKSYDELTRVSESIRL